MINPERANRRFRAGGVTRMRTALLKVEDEVSRLLSLRHLGGLAAERMHGLARANEYAEAFAFYLTALREDLERVKGTCKRAR